VGSSGHYGSSGKKGLKGFVPLGIIIIFPRTSGKQQVKRMGSLKIYIPDELETAFRKRAMDRFGYGKGSISMAARTAIALWMDAGAAKEQEG
jgi:hypothetical protein